MSVSLQKGQKVSLSKEAPGLEEVIAGLGWDPTRGAGDIDCDAAVIMLRDGSFQKKKDLVYFGNLTHESGTVCHQGDNLTGDGDGDDEQIIIKLDKVPDKYDKLVIVVNIYMAGSRKQDFGMIENAFVRLVDAKSNKEIMRYDLSENYEGMTSMIFGELYRHNGEWKFSAIGQGTTDSSLSKIAKRYK